MIETVSTVALSGLAVAILLCVVRMLRGPALADRILAFDTLYVNAIAVLVVLGIREDSALYFDAALLIALTGFVATVALARHAAGDDVIG